MTLWELAQSWPHQLDLYHQVPDTVSEPPCFPSCHRCQLEKWAREKDKEYREAMRVPDAIGLCADLILKYDLGVPEKIESRNP